MKLRYDLDPRERLGVLILSDHPSPDGWTIGATALAADGAFGAGYGLVLDARLARPFDREFTDRFVGWLEDLRRRHDGLRWAIVCAPGRAYGAARELAIHADARGIPAEAFLDLGESLRWLRGELASVAGAS